MVEPEDYVVCRECGKKFSRIVFSHLKRKHNFSMLEYREKHPDAPLVSRKNQLNIIHGLKNKNPRVLGPIELVDFVECRICGGKYSLITEFHFLSTTCKISQYSQGLDINNRQEYLLYFPDARLVSLSTKNKMSKWQIGRKLSEEHKKAIGSGNLGHVHSAETRLRISRNQVRDHRTWEERFGKERADERRAEMARIGSRFNGVSFIQQYGKKRAKEIKNKISSTIRQSFTSGKRQGWSEGQTKHSHPGIMKSSKKRTGRTHSLEARQKISIAVQAQWDSLTNEEKHKKLLKMGRSPNGEESLLQTIVSKFGFKFVGNKRKFVGDFNPDFINEEKKIILEYDGVGGHDPNLPWIPENQAELDTKRNKTYRLAGYTVVIINPDDLSKGEEHILTLFPKWFMDARRLVT